MSSAIITVRLSGGPSRQRFTLFGQSLTQGQLTQMLSQIPRLAIRKTNPGGFDYIIIPDEAVSSASNSAMQYANPNTQILPLREFFEVVLTPEEQALLTQPQSTYPKTKRVLPPPLPPRSSSYVPTARSNYYEEVKASPPPLPPRSSSYIPTARSNYYEEAKTHYHQPQSQIYRAPRLAPSSYYNPATMEENYLEDQKSVLLRDIYLMLQTMTVQNLPQLEAIDQILRSPVEVYANPTWQNKNPRFP